MAIITAGYDGTVDEVQFANLLHRYSVVGAEDFKATTQAGDRIVAISDGTALGPGAVDVATGIPNIQFAAAAPKTTRWDLVALRRDWQPPGGASSIVIIQGSSSKTFPAQGTATTAWNRRPGIVDDQPLYLQEVKGTLLGTRIDLRVWAGVGGSGLFAKDILVQKYLDRVGTRIDIDGTFWRSRLSSNGLLEWFEEDSTGDWVRLQLGNGWVNNNGSYVEARLVAGGTLLHVRGDARYLGNSGPVKESWIVADLPVGMRPKHTTFVSGTHNNYTDAMVYYVTPTAIKVGPLPEGINYQFNGLAAMK